MKILSRILPFAAFAPMLALAQFSGATSWVNALLGFINGTLVPLVFAIAFLVFIWGVFKYFILGGGDEGSREEGKKLMLWGIIAFVVMVSIWGIVNIITDGLFGNSTNLQRIPNVPATR